MWKVLSSWGTPGLVKRETDRVEMHVTTWPWNTPLPTVVAVHRRGRVEADVHACPGLFRNAST
jgi:hypothetical protein